MANQAIFCSAPWYELQIYWDGSLGFCCQEHHKLYPSTYDKKYNVATMSIREWMDSQPMVQVRRDIVSDTPLSICQRCYTDEYYSGTSRRHRTNQKSVIFTKSNFKESYEQSPGYDKFIGVTPVGMPIDLHIDLGNYCNLTCKMCNSQASSAIAAQEVKWGIKNSEQYIGTDWTRNQEVWDRIVTEIVNIPNLSNIHFMGGETLITPRFKEFVQALLDNNRTDVGISFVTNGTHYREDIVELLRPFKRVGIEVSIETLTAHNQYQRQGTDTSVVLANIDRYTASNFEITLRPAISALTIGTYWTLLKYALDRKFVVKGQLSFDPQMTHPAVIPKEIRQGYKKHYIQLLTDYGLSDSATSDYNESDQTQYKRIVQGQIERALNLLDATTSSEQHLRDLVAHCQRWDQVHGYNAIELYPELAEIFKSYGY